MGTYGPSSWHRFGSLSLSERLQEMPFRLDNGRHRGGTVSSLVLFCRMRCSAECTRTAGLACFQKSKFFLA